MVLRTFYDKFTMFFSEMWSYLSHKHDYYRGPYWDNNHYWQETFFSDLTICTCGRFLIVSALYLWLLIGKPCLFWFEVKRFFDQKFFSTSKFPPFFWAGDHHGKCAAKLVRNKTGATRPLPFCCVTNMSTKRPKYPLGYWRICKCFISEEYNFWYSLKFIKKNTNLM